MILVPMVDSLEYRAVLMSLDSYLPPNTCREHMCQDFPEALPEVQQLAYIVEESLLVAADRLSCLPPDARRLTEDEALAVAAFTFDLGSNSELEDKDNLFNQLNDCLRERNDEKINKLKPYLTYLFRAFTKLPIVRTTVYRGIPAENFGIAADRYKIGTRVHWSAFISTSTNMVTAKQSAQGPGGIIFRINALNGRRVSLYSSCINEEEVLLSPNSVFIVTSECYQDEDGYLLVDMIEICGKESLWEKSILLPLKCT